jgi:tripartite-type tricarboxylate transporter receptor subunit TctC
MPRLIAWFAMAVTLVFAGAAAAQDAWPNRPIRMVVPYGAGGSTDMAARIVGAHMERTLRQPILVENRVGGNGALGTAQVNNAPPDGYTLAMLSGSIQTVMPWSAELGFDPLRMSFIGSTHESMYAQFVKGDSPWRTVQELVEHIRANPNQVVYANSGGFGIPDIGMAQLARAVGGLRYRTMPTSGGAEQVLKLLSGDAQTQQNSATPTLPHLRTGAIRAVLILSPAWPELQRLGVPLSRDVYGFSVRNLSAVVGPPGLPEPIRARVEEALRLAMHDTEVLAQMDRIGELIRFRTGAEALQDAREVLAEQRVVGEQLGRVRR